MGRNRAVIIGFNFGANWTINSRVKYNLMFTLFSRWGYNPELIVTYIAVQARTVIIGLNFGADWTMHSGVMTTLSPLSKNYPSLQLNFTWFEEMSKF